MKSRLLNRRRFLAGLVLASPFLVAAEARALEPKWVKVRRVRIGQHKPTLRLVHITDIHHKGDRDYLEGVVTRINALSPDLVCFTGDLIEDGEHLPEALQILENLKSPLYGVPGNHDYWSKTSFAPIAKSLAATGGRWLVNEQEATRDGKILILGAASQTFRKGVPAPKPGVKNIVLMHYPAWIENLFPTEFDLVLAGHSHGGQVRIPFYGPIMVPFGVGRYDMGLFRTRSGPLYVNPGLGWFPVPIRFNCRPEITVFEL